jgi:hypothetical protein
MRISVVADFIEIEVCEDSQIDFGIGWAEDYS